MHIPAALRSWMRVSDPMLRPALPRAASSAVMDVSEPLPVGQTGVANLSGLGLQEPQLEAGPVHPPADNAVERARLQLAACAMALHDNPYDSATLRVRAGLYGGTLSAPELALADYDRIIDLGATASDFVGRAQIHESQGHLSQAEADLARAAVFDFGNEAVFKLFLQTALRNCNVALASQENVPARCRRATLLLALGERAEAHRDLVAMSLCAHQDPAVVRLRQLTDAYELEHKYVALPVSLMSSFSNVAPEMPIVAARVAAAMDLLTPFTTRVLACLQRDFAFSAAVTEPMRQDFCSQRADFNAQIAQLLEQRCPPEQLMQFDALLSGAHGELLKKQLLPLCEAARSAVHAWLKDVGSSVADISVPPDLRGTALRKVLELLLPEAGRDLGGALGAQCNGIALQLRQQLAPAALQTALGMCDQAPFQALISAYREVLETFYLGYRADSLVRTARELAPYQIEASNTILATQPDDVPALASRAWSYVATGDDGRALADLTRVVALAPTACNYLRRAKHNLARQQYAHAEFDAQAAVRLAPRDAAAYIMRAEVRLAQGSYTEAALDGLQGCQLAVDSDEFDAGEELAALAYRTAAAPTATALGAARGALPTGA